MMRNLRASFLRGNSGANAKVGLLAHRQAIQHALAHNAKQPDKRLTESRDQKS